MLTINNLLPKLFDEFKFFKENVNYTADELLPYNVLGDFAIFFQKKIVASELTNTEIDQFFSFVNEMVDSEDKEVQNILVVELFELFSDNEKTASLAMEKMGDKGKQLLKKTLAGWK